MRQAISQARGLSDRVRRARFLAELAVSGTAVFDLAEMEALAHEALHEGRELGDAQTIIGALTAIGFVTLAEDDPASAIRAFDEARTMQLLNNSTRLPRTSGSVLLTCGGRHAKVAHHSGRCHARVASCSSELDPPERTGGSSRLVRRER